MARSRILLFCILLSGCTRPQTESLLVYSPHGQEMLTAFAKAYEKEHPGVAVHWLDMGSEDVYDRIRTERENPQADIWWGAPSTIFARAEAESLLEPYTPSWHANIPRQWKSAVHLWYGTLLTPEVIMYNNHRLSAATAPHDWDDLVQPEWKDKIIIRNPVASGTMRTIFGAIIMREQERHGSIEAGFSWLRRLDANTKTYTADPVQMYLKIAREEGLVSLWDLPDVVIQIQHNNYPFGFILPRSGTPMITDCIALVRGTKHREEAIRFYEFVTSVSSLVRQANEFSRIPARTDIPHQDLPAWLDTLHIQPMNIDWDTLGAHERGWMTRWSDEVKGKG
jgi:iron(III) transport system substrate-binding protein